MDTLLHSLSSLTRLPKDRIRPLSTFFEVEKVESRTSLLSINDCCSKVWFVGNGSLRAFYDIEEEKRIHNNNGSVVLREVTSWIVPEGGFLTDISSFLHKKPASYNIESIETSKLYSLSHENYSIIQRSHPEISQALFEHTLVMADLRVRMTNLRLPKERLKMFELLYPTLKGRLPINTIASYLNIDPCTLSRLRYKSKKWE